MKLGISMKHWYKVIIQSLKKKSEILLLVAALVGMVEVVQQCHICFGSLLGEIDYKDISMFH